MAASTKHDLLVLARAEYRKLASILDMLPETLRLVADDDGVSPKDVVGHRAHWIELFKGWYSEGQLGNPVHFPAEGYKWNELKRYNADLRRRQSKMNWDDAVALLNLRHGELLEFIESLSQADLYDGPMKGGKNAWTTGRWAEAAGPSHYRSAAKYLRQRIRASQQVKK
ncbi:MAG: ClbS/DfsB family four-helix bundle protein [Roseibium sp.]|uniref:ClbS/DfsB family four-helix bundle protein n=1 Tax=Roseibium sp. TaxID=1936156 RepID=UPI003D9C1C1B